jgi:hypothetical protein
MGTPSPSLPIVALPLFGKKLRPFVHLRVSAVLIKSMPDGRLYPKSLGTQHSAFLPKVGLGFLVKNLPRICQEFAKN